MRPQTSPLRQPHRAAKPVIVEQRAVAGDRLTQATAQFSGARRFETTTAAPIFSASIGDEEKTRDGSTAVDGADDIHTGDAGPIPYDHSIALFRALSGLENLPAAARGEMAGNAMHAVLPKKSRRIDEESLIPLLHFFASELIAGKISGAVLLAAFTAVLAEVEGRAVSTSDGEISAPLYCIAALLPSEHAPNPNSLALPFLAEVFRTHHFDTKELLREFFPYLQRAHEDRLKAFSYLYILASAGTATTGTTEPFVNLAALANFESRVNTTGRHDALEALRNHALYAAEPAQLLASLAIVQNECITEATATLDLILKDHGFKIIHGAVSKTLRTLHKHAHTLPEKQLALIPLWEAAMRAGKKREAEKFKNRITALITRFQKLKADALVAAGASRIFEDNGLAAAVRLPEEHGDVMPQEWHRLIHILAKEILPEARVELRSENRVRSFDADGGVVIEANEEVADPQEYVKEEGSVGPLAIPRFVAAYRLRIVLPQISAFEDRLQKLLWAISRLQYRERKGRLFIGRIQSLDLVVGGTAANVPQDDWWSGLKESGLGGVRFFGSDGTTQRLGEGRQFIAKPSHRVAIALDAHADRQWQQCLTTSALAHFAQIRGELDPDRVPEINFALASPSANNTAQLQSLIEALATHPELLGSTKIRRQRLWRYGAEVATVSAFFAVGGVAGITGGLISLLLAGIPELIVKDERGTNTSTAFFVNDQRLCTAHPSISSSGERRVTITFDRNHPQAAELCAQWNAVPGAVRAVLGIGDRE